MPSTSEVSGWSVSSTDVTAAGRRGSEPVIRSHPTTCELNASSTSQPCSGHDGTKSTSPIAMPAMAQPTAATHVASNSGAAGAEPVPDSRISRMKPV